jgi:tetratricopeptide (TPR) repeat protein
MRTPTGPALRRCILVLLCACGVPACGAGEDPHTVPVVAKKTEAKPAEPRGDDAMATRYLEIKERFAALGPEDKAGPGRIVAELGTELRGIADTARDLHLRANASLLLGTLYEASGDARSAISFYRQVVALLPEDAAPRRVLAVALATDKQYAAALPEQEKVVADDPDDLEAWLLLGELAVKAEQKERATEAYAAYEMRRKGLIDGISLKKADGVFILPAEQRAACARALIPARDNGTAIALLYALSIETEPAVRAAIVEAMGTQRLGGYKQALEERLKTETAQEVKEAIIWALAEIQRDPLDTRPGPAPEAAPAADAPVPPVPADSKAAPVPADSKPVPADSKPVPADSKPVPADSKAPPVSDGAMPAR